MNTLFNIVLGLHITAGSIALISGFIPMVAKKGKKLHKRAGHIYFWSMMGVVVSAIYLGIYHWNPFLLIIGVFSFYLTMKGFIGLKLKGKYVLRYSRLLGAVALITFLFSLLLFLMGLLSFTDMIFRLQVLPLFFGLIGMTSSFSDLKMLFLKPITLVALARIRSHIVGMVGAYIATVTAFIVANSLIEPALVGWIAPTVIGSIFISYQISVWTKKLTPPKPPLEKRVREKTHSHQPTGQNPERMPLL